MAAVLHHVPVNRRTDIMHELATRLCGKGKLFIFEHNPLNPVTRWVVRQCPFDCDAILIKPSELIAHLKDVGLHFLRRDYLVFFPRVLSRCRPIERFLGWCPAGAQYVITATKDPLTDSCEDRNTESGIRR